MNFDKNDTINFNTYIVIMMLSLSFIGCNKTVEEKKLTDTYQEKTIRDFQVEKQQLTLNQQEGKWYYNDQPYSGFAVKFYSNGQLAEKVGFQGGKREGKAVFYYDNGLVSKIANFRANKLHGVVNNWSPNPSSIKIVESNYVNGVRHGVQKKWYPNGQLFKEMNINMGVEEGMQKAWRANGKLYINYEAKNGRIFGLKKANLCYALEDEEVQF